VAKSFKTITMVTLLLGNMLSLSAVAGDIACTVPMQAWSNLEKMTKGDFSANVHWDQVTLTSTSIGYGPTANRENETTIIDGKVYFDHPDASGKVIKATTMAPSKKLGSAMLIIASPKAWIKMPDAMDAISSFDDLNFVFDDVVDDQECGDDVVLPFKIVGHANKLSMSLDTKPNDLLKDYQNKEVVIEGIYNRDSKEKYFMVKGYNIHPHVLMTQDQIAGHLRDVDLAEGATLYLPQK